MTKQPYEFKTSDWVKISDDLHGNYESKETRFKRSMRKSNLYDLSDLDMLRRE